jgi:TolB-like protein/Flp pilus assembly protein TadD
MGEVYKARDTKLDRDVAVKVLPDSLAGDPSALARFEREAKAVAALSHPNILSIFDYGSHGGISYAVMELLEGETLRGLLASGPIPQTQAVDYALQVARGLAAAHDRRIVHRDLKPENLFVMKDGRVKILDFGLAKLIHPESDASVSEIPTEPIGTAPGVVLGTVGYMSPEQLRGQPADSRSDIFSFGATLYEMLSGRRAFHGTSAVDTMTAILREDPPDLSESGRNVSPALAHIVRHCLEKDRENRFQSSKDIVFALSEAIGLPVTDMVHPRRRVSAGAKVLVGIALTLGLSVAGILITRRVPRESSPTLKRVVVLPFENLGAPEDDYFADGVADQIRGKLAALPGIEVIARASSAPYRKTTKAPKQIAEELSAPYLLTATVRWLKGGSSGRVQVSPELVEVREAGPPAAKWQQLFDRDLTDVFQVQADIATRVAEALGIALAERERTRLSERPTQNLAAYDAFLKAEAASGALTRVDSGSLRKALDLYGQAVALDPGFALAWARIGTANSIRYANFGATAEVAERAREASERALAISPNRPEAYYALGSFYRLVRNDPQRALEEYTKGLRLAPTNPDIVRGIANVDQRLGRWNEALEHSLQAERLDPRGVNNILNLATVLLRLHRSSESRKVLDRGLAIAPDSLDLIELRVMSFLVEGDLPGARAFLKDSLARTDPAPLVAYLANFQDLAWVFDDEQAALLRRLAPSAFDDDEGEWAICQAQACAFAGDAACKRNYAERAYKAYEAKKVGTNDVGALGNLALALAYSGRREEAILRADQIGSLRPLTQDARNGPYLRHQQARVYIVVGDYERALDIVESLLKTPYFLSPGWLRIDPNFDPLRNNPRFQRLVDGPR